jgi:hypothetical protein
MRIAASVAVIAVAQWGMGCGGSTNTVDGSTTTLDASAGDISVGADDGGHGIADDSSEVAAVDGGPGQGACPDSPPQAGAACDAGLACGSDLFCEYGAGATLAEDLLARCKSGTWSTSGPTVQLPIDAGSLGPGCPPTFFYGVNNALSCSGPPCAYPEGTCRCQTFDHVAPDGGAASGWTCVSRPLGPGCPPTLAATQANPPCPSNGVVCNYLGGTCSCNTGSPWVCVVPDNGCPAERPRLGSRCNTEEPKRCAYANGQCQYPSEDLSCSCEGVWIVTPSNTVCE